jgi:hypothetical protein
MHIAHRTERLCLICQSLKLTRLELRDTVARELGTAQELSSRTSCPLCCFFSSLVKQAGPVYSTQTPGTRTSKPVSNAANVVLQCANFKRTNPWIFNLSLAESVRAQIEVHEFGTSDEQRAPQDANIEFPSSLKIGGPLDLALIRGWLSQCEHGHQVCQQIRSRYPKPLSVLMFDVHKSRVVPAKTTERYIALSYVLGDFESQTPRQCIPSHVKSEGAAGVPYDTLPRVVQDAIRVVLALGERYLWIDYLCIPQDNEIERIRLISQMHVLYSQAFLTIIAISGKSADFPLPGVSATSREMIELVQDVHSHAHLRLKASPPQFNEIVQSSPFETRAWTLQERLLSTRRLFFTPWQIYFECPTGLKSEYDSVLLESTHSETKSITMLDPLASTRSTPSHEENLSVWRSGFLTYANLVSSYTQRHLSVPADIMSAFSGLHAALSQHCGTFYLYGLPLEALSIALLWAPCGPWTKREEKTEPVNKPTTMDGTYIDPSWCWASRVGPVSYYPVIPDLIERDRPEWFESELDTVVIYVAENAGRKLKINEQSMRDQTYLNLESDQSKSYPPLDYPKGRFPHSEIYPTLNFVASATPSSTFTPQTHDIHVPSTALLDKHGRRCGVVFDYISVFPQDIFASPSKPTKRKGLSRLLRRDSPATLEKRELEFIALSRIAIRHSKLSNSYTIPSLITPDGTEPGYICELFSEEHFRSDKSRTSRKGMGESLMSRDEEDDLCMVNVMLIEWHQLQGTTQKNAVVGMNRWAERLAIGQIHCDAWDSPEVKKVRREVCLR